MYTAARLRLFASRLLKFGLGALLVSALAFLPFAGRFFSAQDDLQRADVIFVLAGARIERWLEGVDLYKEGWAPRLVLSPGRTERVETQLAQRGVRYPRDGDLAQAAAIALGVPAGAIAVLPDSVDNTAAEAAALHRALGTGAVRRVIVVTSPYHVRRAGYAFRREFRPAGVEIVMRSTRYTTSDPSRWWTKRGDIRFIMSELPKFIAYIAGLGE
jgi:uncharacterized SAM-binding protein YcdF (DUF218 family)